MTSSLWRGTFFLLILCALGSAWGSKEGESPEKLAFLKGDGQVMMRFQGQTRQVAAGPAALVAWSPSGDRIAYVERGDLYSLEAIVLRVVSEAGKSLDMLTIQQGGVIDEIPLEWRDLDQLVWLDNDRLALGGSSDPSNDVLAVVDFATRKVAYAYIGREFSWSPSKAHLASVGWIPHDAPPEIHARERIEIDGKTVYPATGREKSSGRIRGPLCWSPDGRSLAFLERREGQHQLVFLTMGGSERGIPLTEVSQPVVLAWAGQGDAVLLKSGQGYVAVEIATGKQVELPEPAVFGRFPAFAERRRREEIERSVGAWAADWWPAQDRISRSAGAGNSRKER